MLALTSSARTRNRFPWEQGRACHEDRAMGLELELIELVHRRDLADGQGGPVQHLDDQIALVMGDLAAEAAVAGLA